MHHLRILLPIVTILIETPIHGAELETATFANGPDPLQLLQIHLRPPLTP